MSAFKEDLGGPHVTVGEALLVMIIVAVISTLFGIKQMCGGF